MTEITDGTSVISPTYGRVTLVERLVTSVRESGEASGSPWELILVDDSNALDSAAIMRLCDGETIRYARGPKKVGAKRNAGAKLARYSVLFFIDSDCAPVLQTVGMHHQAHVEAKEDVGAFAGPTHMEGQPTGHWVTMDESLRYNQPYGWPLEYARLLWCTTSNLSVWQSTFQDVGGFDDQTLTVVGGEDIDFGVRLLNLGKVVYSLPAASVVHAREMPNHRAIARRMFMYGQADTYLSLKYPERTELYFNPVSVALLAGVLRGSLRRSALSGGLVGATTLVGMWSVELLRRSRRAGRIRGLRSRSLAVVVDTSFEAGAVWGALKAGSWLLLFKRFRYHAKGDFV